MISNGDKIPSTGLRSITGILNSILDNERLIAKMYAVPFMFLTRVFGINTSSDILSVM